MEWLIDLMTVANVFQQVIIHEKVKEHRLENKSNFIKVGLSPSKKICFICFIESPSKMIKKCFLFHLKSSFRSRHKFLS